MSKIQFEQISENEIEVSIPAETPMLMVEKLTKSFREKGLIEDLNRSTAGVRFFYRPEDNATDLADKLIKSLSKLDKSDDLPYWHPKAQMANQKRVREMETAERRAKAAPAPMAPKAPSPSKPAQMYDHTPAAMNTAGGTGKRYAFISDPVAKIEEHESNCECGKCMEVEKSGYGPKGGGQYTPADNVRRKMNNTGEAIDSSTNANVKAFSSKPGQLSAKEQASVAAKIQARANKQQPVKQWTAEEIAAENAKRGLKKGWANHNSIPSAEEEIMKYAAEIVPTGENAAANQLAQMMHKKSLLTGFQQPSKAEFDAAGEAMGLGVSEEMVKSAEQQWNGALNNWLAEATKPISQRFASEEEELAYWAKIKVADSDRGEPGY